MVPKFRRRLEQADLGTVIQKRIGDSELATKLLAYIEGTAPMETADGGEVGGKLISHFRHSALAVHCSANAGAGAAIVNESVVFCIWYVFW
jgi:hypothetical protein